MAESNEYDLTPEEPKKAPPPPASKDTPLPPAPPPPPGFVPPVPIMEGPDDDPEAVAAKDLEENRITAMVGYVCFLVPLIFAPRSRFARYHANQALLVFIYAAAWLVLLVAFETFRWVLGQMPGSVVGLIGTLLSCIGWLVVILLFLGGAALGVMGIVNVANGEMKPLPVIGKFTLIHEAGHGGGVPAK